MLNGNLWHRHVMANRLQSAMLLLSMGVLLGLVGWLLWGVEGLILLLVGGVVLLLFNPTATPWLIMRMYGAVRLTSDQAPLLHSALNELSLRAGLETVPTLYYIPSAAVNAFAMGQRGNAAIAVSDGLLRVLDSRETVSVLAHEVSHVRNNDIRVMGLADLFSRLTSVFSLFGMLLLFFSLPLLLLGDAGINWLAILVLLFAPNLSALAQLGLSRTREYDADLNAVGLTGDPEALARALVKIDRQGAGMFERIFLPGRRVPEPSLLRTHPPTDERVKRLLQLGVDRSTPERVNLHRGGVLPRFPGSAGTLRPPRWRATGLWH